MKYSKFLIITIFFWSTLVINCSQKAYSQIYTKSAKKEFIESLLNEYSYEATNMLKYLKENNFNYGLYLKNASTEAELLFYAAIMVHEATHAYGLIRMEELLREKLENTNHKFTQFEYGLNLINGAAAGAIQKGIIKNYNYTYVADSIDLLMNDCVQFCENEIFKIVSTNKIKTLYRYPYMNSCKRFGIFSYVEEMSANLQTIKTGIELTPYLLKKLDETNDVNYLKAALLFLTSLDAYYDFKLLIAWHLMYAKEYHNETYNTLMDNTNLKVTYSLLCRQYEELEPKITEIVNEIEKQYYPSFQQDLKMPEHFTFSRGIITYRFHLPLKNTNKLRALYTPEVNEMLAQFRIQECDFNNYSQFASDPILEYKMPDVSEIADIEFFNNNKKHKLLSDLLENNSPEVFAMLNDYYTIPRKISCPTTDWVLEPIIPINDYVDSKDIIGTIPWAVYNLSHSFVVVKGYYVSAINNSCLDLYEGVYAYSINPQKTIVVKNTKVIRSRDIANNIPSKYRGTYFNSNLNSRDKNLGTQKFGICGLLDEFNSFYYAMRVTLDLLNLYKDEFKLNTEKWLDFFGRSEMIYSTYAEYKVYLFEYLNYCKLNEPEIYSEISNNEEFKEAFFQIDKNWAIALNEYDDFKKEVELFLTENGIKYTETDEMIRLNNMAIPIKRKYTKDGLQYINSNRFNYITEMLDFKSRALTY